MLILSFVILLTSQSFADDIEISWGNLKSSENVPYFPHFWTSTGFSPVNTHGSVGILSEDELTNLALIGSLPRGSLSHVRIHWLLDLVSARCTGEDLIFDFSRLDALMDWLHRYHLHPGFELMGNPSGLFTDLNDERQQHWWRQLVKSLTSRYIAHYGLDVVKQWRFETWNEPDLKMYNTLNFTLESFKAYFVASMNGLRESSGGELKLGGPAGLFRVPPNKHPLCWGFLDFVSQHKDLELAFISFHRKGNASSRLIVNEGKKLVRQFKRRYPSLRHLPLANDEADPLTGWWRDEGWRGDVRYAAMMARNVIDHLGFMVHRTDFPMKFISNDNAFLSMTPHYFNQRTLLARFQMNNTEPHHTQFFLKPVYLTLALMSMLGDRELPLQINPPDPRVAALAAGSWHKDTTFSAALLLVFNNDTECNPNDNLRINLTLPLSEWSLTNNEPRYSIFLLDNNHTNPAAVWEQAGRPNYPSPVLRKAIRESQEYRPVLSERITESETIYLNLQLPSVALVQICTRPDVHPGQVTDLHALHVTQGEVLLMWKDSQVGTRCLLRYDVEFRPKGRQDFLRINLNQDSILLNFHFQLDLLSTLGDVFGEYRVRAVDLWSRPGVYSSTLNIHQRE